MTSPPRARSARVLAAFGTALEASGWGWLLGLAGLHFFLGDGLWRGWGNLFRGVVFLGFWSGLFVGACCLLLVWPACLTGAWLGLRSRWVGAACGFFAGAAVPLFHGQPLWPAGPLLVTGAYGLVIGFAAVQVHLRRLPPDL